jgi:hypothetical protein
VLSAAAWFATGVAAAVRRFRLLAVRRSPVAGVPASGATRDPRSAVAQVDSTPNVRYQVRTRESIPASNAMRAWS